MCCVWCFPVADASARGVGPAPVCSQATTLRTKSKSKTLMSSVCYDTDSFQAGSQLHLCWHASSSVQQAYTVCWTGSPWNVLYIAQYAFELVAPFIYAILLHTVYRACGYLQVVQDVAGASMQEAVDKVRALPEYNTKGEVSAQYLQHVVHLHCHWCSG